MIFFPKIMAEILLEKIKQEYDEKLAQISIDYHRRIVESREDYYASLMELEENKHDAMKAAFPIPTPPKANVTKIN